MSDNSSAYPSNGSDDDIIEEEEMMIGATEKPRAQTDDRGQARQWHYGDAKEARDALASSDWAYWERQLERTS